MDEPENYLIDAANLDRRRQQQITNQIKIINRLLDGATYDQILQETVNALSEAEVKCADLEAKVAALRAAAVTRPAIARTDTATLPEVGAE